MWTGWDGEEYSEEVAASDLADVWEVGDHVQYWCSDDQEWYPAEIVYVNAEGFDAQTYDVDDEEGYRREYVAPDDLRA